MAGTFGVKKGQQLLSAIHIFLFHKLYLKDAYACDDSNHDDNHENNESVEVIWGPPSPTIDFVQPSMTRAHTSTLSTIGSDLNLWGSLDLSKQMIF